ncbi:MAG TPA: amino acid adenylation domain-containing protein [Acidimicrobiales bacterium]|nr:amino acid adenylation domain-containing protein [Acidimicrobiales bacterium]
MASASATSLVDPIEDQVRRRPGAVAVVATDGALTYAELDARANRLARHLGALGVGAETVVGVCVERSLEMAVGFLGVLKAGGACMPLDPSYPMERLALMLEDSGTPVVLTCEGLLERLPPHRGRTVCVDADWQEVAGRSSEVLDRTAAPENLAYVIYTSGSTGEPKGVMLTHRGLLNHNRAAAGLFELTPSDRVLQFCSISFDISIEEMFPSWASGATVVLRPDDLPLLGPQWLAWLRAQRVTVLNLPAAYWHEWARDLQGMGESLPAEVRLVIAGGEKVLGSAYRTWLTVGGDRARWLNGYGPAEATVTVTAYEPPPGSDMEGRDPPIGRPLPGATAHVLDERGLPVPAGEAGELYVGGEGLARGYLGRPGLTAERFLPDPFSGRPGARLYRTGDRVWQLPAGDLEFVDRLDHQLKVRGFRIEAGEVEAALVGHPAVAEAVVTAREDTPGDKRLVAYFVAAGAPAPGSSELRRFLSDRLPPYMVPTSFVAVDAFPRTPNGKVDRAAFPAPPHSRPDLATEWVAPRTTTEEALAAIWSEVLGIAGVGVEDDFFELGGHSLLATQIVTRVREAFANDLPLQAIFERPTVAGLAELVDARAERARPAPPLVRRPRRPGDRLPLSLAQEQMLRLELDAQPPGLYNVTALHRLSAPVDRGALWRALEYMAERHESLRTGFAVGTDGPYQFVAPTVAVELTFSVIDLADPAEAAPELHRRVAEQDATPFELASPPLFRSQLVELGDGRSQLVVTFDHLIVDMTSAYIFLGEVATAYEALVDGRAPELSPLPVQYADFAIWQREWLTDDRLAEQYEYWRKVLTGMPMGPAVPFDHVPSAPTRRIARVAVDVPPDLYRRLEAVARSARTTVFVVLTAAVKAVLSRYGGLPDIVLSTTLSGRQRNECEGVIGMFAGVGRMRTDLSGDPTFAEVVERARETVLGLFEHQDIPFMKVRDTLFPDFPRMGDYVRTASVIPIELLYFHAAHDHWAPGSGVVDRPGSDEAVDDVFFRGQLQPLSLTFVDDGSQMWGHLSYKLDFYDEATVQELASGLARLLGAVAADPGLRLSELPVEPAALRAGRG